MPTNYRFAIAALLALLAVDARAQNPDDGFWYAFGDKVFSSALEGGQINDLAASGNSVVVAGKFYGLNDLTIWNIARFDSRTRTWSDLDTGIAHDMLQFDPTIATVRDVAVTPQGVVYVGAGYYRGAGGSDLQEFTTTNGLRFNGSWSLIPDLDQDAVSILTDKRGALYSIDGAALRRYDGGWSTLTTTAAYPYGGSRSALHRNFVERNDYIYWATGLTDTTSARAVLVRQWDIPSGTMKTLEPLRLYGVGNSAFRLRAIAAGPDGALYAAGLFEKAGTLVVNNIVRWNAGARAWVALGNGLDAEVTSLAVGRNGELYAGGLFEKSGSLIVNHIAMWDGSQWHALGSGTNADVSALAVDSLGFVYAGGSFTIAGAKGSQFIARWDKQGEVIKPPLIVNSTDDRLDGSCDKDHCSLRDAFFEANATKSADTIRFDLAGAGRVTIKPDSALPRLKFPIVIEAMAGNDTIVIDGSNIEEDAVGLYLSGGRSMVSGLTIVNFWGSGIRIDSSTLTFIERCRIGTIDGTTPAPNAMHGIHIVDAEFNFIGQYAIDGAYPAENIIAFNDRAGVFVESGKHNTVGDNDIHDNGGIGIDLAPEGRTSNDDLDADDGPNSLQNYPIIDSANTKLGITRIFGRLYGPPGLAQTIRVYTLDKPDNDGYGEGRSVIASVVVEADPIGWAPFEAMTTTTLSPDQTLSATATDINGSSSEFSRCWPKRIVVVDRDGFPIPNKRFGISRVERTGADYRFVRLDSIETDDNGEIMIPKLAEGDTIGVGRRVKIHANPWRTTPLPTAYTIDSYNGWFDLTSFDLIHDTVDTAFRQDVKLQHTTVAINLLVAIEWDAQPGYVAQLGDAFRSLANYYYDVGDGQLRIDTVFIYDDHSHAGRADVLIHASTLIHPSTLGNWLASVPAQRVDQQIYMPRMWWGKIDAITDMSAVLDYPYLLDDPFFYRTVGHELGHYALGLFDEYEGNCNHRNLGMMHSQYPRSGTSATEISWASMYSNCSTEQLVKRGMPCWEWVQTVFQGQHDGFLVPVITPLDRPLTAVDYLVGPNEFRSTPNVDVGKQVVVIDRTAACTAQDVIMRTRRQDVPVARVHINHRIESSRRVIAQGRTDGIGRARILGYHPGDVVVAVGAGRLFQVPRIVAGASDPRTWMYGTAVGGSSGTSEYGNAYSTTGDTIELELRSLSGEHGAMPTLSSTGDGFKLRVDIDDATIDSITHIDTAGITHLPVVQTGRGVESNADATPRRNEHWTFDAHTDADRYFFTATVSVANVGGAVAGIAFDAAAELRVSFDSVVNDRVMITTMHYLPTLAGLDSGDHQIGATFATASLAGAERYGASLAIHYDESDLSGDGVELDPMSLTIQRWDTTMRSWTDVESAVDTMNRRVTARVSSLGTYTLAARERAPELPSNGRSLELLDAYPNPFGTTTTIPVLVATESDVAATVYSLIGEQVRQIDLGRVLPGRRIINWDGRDANGALAPEGVYVVSVRSGGELVSTRVVRQRGLP